MNWRLSSLCLVAALTTFGAAACSSKSSTTGTGGTAATTTSSTTSTGGATSSSTTSTTSSTSGTGGAGGATTSSSTASSTSSSSGSSGCGSSPSLANDVQPIFSQTCALSNCHTGNPAEEQLDLSAGNSYGSLVNKAINTCNHQGTRVVPGDVPNSYLINKITGIGMCAGVQMPNQGQALTQMQIDTITAWVCEGAPNN